MPRDEDPNLTDFTITMEFLASAREELMEPTGNINRKHHMDDYMASVEDALTLHRAIQILETMNQEDPPQE